MGERQTTRTKRGRPQRSDGAKERHVDRRLPSQALETHAAVPVAPLLRYLEDHPEASALRPQVTRQLVALQGSRGNQYVQRLSKRKASRATTSRRINPTLSLAREHVHVFFERHAQMALALAGLCDDGLKQFKIYSQKEFDRSDSALIQLFEEALKLVPAAAPLLRAFRTLGKPLLAELSPALAALAQEAGRTAQQAGEMAQKAAQSYEAVTGAAKQAAAVIGAAKKVAQVPGEPEVSDAKAILVFESGVIKEKGNAMIGRLAACWKGEEIAKKQLEALRYSPADIDLEAEVKKYLPIPEASELEKGLSAVADKFELMLYRQFYVLSGRAERKVEWVHAYHGQGWAKNEVDVSGMPEGVQSRIHQFGLPTWEWVTKGMKEVNLGQHAYPVT